jgi:hypothetical protein
MVMVQRNTAQVSVPSTLRALRNAPELGEFRPSYDLFGGRVDAFGRGPVRRRLGGTRGRG